MVWWGKHLEGFGKKLHICVEIFLVHNLEDATDNISCNLSDLEEDYHLLLYAVLIGSILYTPLQTKKELADGTVIDKLQKLYLYII